MLIRISPVVKEDYWCTCVNMVSFSFQVDNFTSSFSDGRVLCLLVHYYHPSLLPLEKISYETTFTQSVEKLAKEENCDNQWEEELGVLGHFTVTFSPSKHY